MSSSVSMSNFTTIDIGDDLGVGVPLPPLEYKRRMENFGVRSPMTVECRPIFIDSAVAAKIYHLYHFCMVLIIESFYRKNMLGTVHKNGSGLSE